MQNLLAPWKGDNARAALKFLTSQIVDAQALHLSSMFAWYINEFSALLLGKAQAEAGMELSDDYRLRPLTVFAKHYV